MAAVPHLDALADKVLDAVLGQVVVCTHTAPISEEPGALHSGKPAPPVKAVRCGAVMAWLVRVG